MAHRFIEQLNVIALVVWLNKTDPKYDCMYIPAYYK